MADRAVMIVLGTKLDPASEAALNKLAGKINKLQKDSELKQVGKGIMGSLPGAGLLMGGAAGLAAEMTTKLVAAVSEAFDSAMKVMGEQRRFKAYFGELTPLATEWAEQLAEKSKYCEVEIGALMGQIFNLGRGLGMTTGEASDLARSFSDIAIDFAAFQGMNPEEAFQVLQGAVAGHFRALTQYGIIFTDEEKKALEVLKDTGEEAKYTSEIIELLTQKMGAMKGAASAEGVGRDIRAAEQARKEAMEDAGKVLTGAARLFKEASSGLVLLLSGKFGTLLGENVFSNEGRRKRELADEAARDAARKLAEKDEDERLARAIAQEKKDKRIDTDIKRLATLEEQIEKLKELNKLAHGGDDAAAAAARDQALAVRKLMDADGGYKNILDAREQAALRKKLSEGKYEELLAEKAKEVLELERQRAEIAQKSAEAKEKEARHAAELYGSMSALERAQARQVLESLKGGGVDAWMQLGEKGRSVAEKLNPDRAREYARQVAEREGFAGMVGPAATAAGKVNIANVVKTEITAKLELDGPNLAQQFMEKLWPNIQQFISANLDNISSGIRLSQAGGQAVANASAQ